MVLFLGFIPQGFDPESPRLIDNIGLTSVTNSWPYLMCALYLLVVLGFTIVKRINNFSVKNIAFLLNHMGLWLVVVTASLGSADMWRLTMQLEAKHPTTKAYDSQANIYDMGFGMVLLDFDIEEYPAELALMNEQDYSIEIAKGGKLATVEEGASAKLENYTLNFVRYISFAGKYDGGYDTTSQKGGARAVYIKAKNEDSGKEYAGWVCDGSYAVPASYLNVGDRLSIAMTQLSPKKFSSDIRVYVSMDEYEDHHIEVNEPVRIHGWKVYQTGYDEKMGRWSERSIIELVRDPWLPVVYVGIFMMLIGSLYLLWMGKGRIKKEES